MVMRPDLFDPHTVHFHGFPHAAPVFDGVPDGVASPSTWASTFTYYYKIVEPGTYMYHCHVEATEHMQMGMLGNLYVMPAQNRHGRRHRSAGSRHASHGPSTPTTTATARPATTWSTRSRSGRSTRTSTTQHLAVQPLPFADDARHVPDAQRPRLPGHGRIQAPDVADADDLIGAKPLVPDG